MEAMDEAQAGESASALPPSAPRLSLEVNPNFTFVDYERRDLEGKRRIRRYHSCEKRRMSSFNTVMRRRPLDVALLQAVCQGKNLSTVIDLLEAGASASAQEAGHAQRTALHIACSKRNVPLVKLLLSYGANLEARDILGNRPMDVATYANAETVNALKTHSSLESGARELSRLLAKVTVNSNSREFGQPSEASLQAPGQWL